MPRLYTRPADAPCTIAASNSMDPNMATIDFCSFMVLVHQLRHFGQVFNPRWFDINVKCLSNEKSGTSKQIACCAIIKSGNPTLFIPLRRHVSCMSRIPDQLISRDGACKAARASTQSVSPRTFMKGISSDGITSFTTTSSPVSRYSSASAIFLSARPLRK